ncbi:hypothetical protein N431DRAFT_545216 [Stipitochalara longipes BDJ]|nr:hypothetical protein N431DRAFT_545216 [Stipitochalara longipes BDJ]
MRVTIQLDRSRGDPNTFFTSTDYVRGIIQLNLQGGDAITRITVELSGTLLGSVVAAATNPLDSTMHAVDNHKLLDLCYNLFPPPHLPISPKGFCLPTGTNAFPFQFRFPILSTCHETNNYIAHRNSTLPPSFKVQAQNSAARAEMRYWLKVKVERPGRFKYDVTEQQELNFMPLDPSLPPPMLWPVHSKNSRHLLPNAVGSGTSPPSHIGQHGEPCTVTLEATLPSPAILYTKGSLPLQIFATAKGPEPTASGPVRLRSLTVTLRTEITVTVGPNSTTWPVLHQLVNHPELEIELQHLDEPPGQLNADLWKDCVVPEVTPSFTTCTSMQQHFLVVTGGFSHGDTGPIQVIKTTINVDIHTGVKPAPDGSGEEQDESSDEETYVPWRVGSERHLGIRRRSGSISTPPPAYF